MLSPNNLLTNSYTDLMVKGPVNIALTFNNGEILCGLEDIYKKLATPLFINERVYSQEDFDIQEFIRKIVFQGYVGIIEEPVYDVLKRTFEVYKPCEIQKLLSNFVATGLNLEEIKLLRVFVTVGSIGMEVTF